MAIRFIDTNFFKSPFVRSLKAPMKTLYCFIICDCNGAGIWNVDFEAAELYTGSKIDNDIFLKSFIETGKATDLKNGKMFFKDFIEHQYPTGLSSTNPAHKNFVAELLKYSLIDNNLKVIQRGNEGAYMPLSRDISNSKGNSNSKSKGNSNGKEQKKIELIYPFESETFMKVWGVLKEQKKWKPKSIEALQASLDLMSEESEADAIQMMKKSIAGGWQGIFKLEKNERTTENQSKQGITGSKLFKEFTESEARRNGNT